jgi:hypothetical protein
MNGLCYWYWVADAEQRGVQIRIAKTIPAYLVGGVKYVGVMEREKRDSMAKNVVVERSGTEEAADVLGRLGGLEVEQIGVEIKIRNTEEVKKREERLKTLRQELRQLEGLDAAQGADIRLVDGLDARGRVRDEAHMVNNRPRKRRLQQDNKRRRPVVEEHSCSETDEIEIRSRMRRTIEKGELRRTTATRHNADEVSSDSDFDSTHIITSSAPTQSVKKRRKTHAAPQITHPKPSSPPSDQQPPQSTSLPHQPPIIPLPATSPTLSPAHLFASIKLAISNAEQLVTDIKDIEDEERDLTEKMDRLRARKLEVEEKVKQNKKAIGELAGKLA